MNIVFFTKYFSIGGVEVVTVCLANLFIRKGHNVHIVSFENPDKLIAKRINQNVKIAVLDKPLLSLKNIIKLHNMFLHENINVILNQWGHISIYCLLLEIARFRLPIKIISIYHNQPGSNLYTTMINYELNKSVSCFRKIYLKIERYIITEIYAWNMKYVYFHSNKYVLLSYSFVEEFCKFLNIKKSLKITIIPNPITIIHDNSIKHGNNIKKKIMIFVGRLDRVQKHPERILAVWEDISLQFRDWSLYIIGDGPEKENLKAYCIERNIERINFMGFCDPEPYYLISSILLLTSDFEGFPLVLIEAMSFGVIPIVLNTFLSVEDIIVNNETGLIIEPCDRIECFDKDNMTRQITGLIKNEDQLRKISGKATGIFTKYSQEAIYQKWQELFMTICE
jgi:glycosyltransferase involved in cell wall biosynthesis